MLQRQLADLGVKRLDVYRCSCRFHLRFTAKNSDGAFQKLALPLRDLVGMYVKLLSQLRKCLFSLDGGQSHQGRKDTFGVGSGVVFSPLMAAKATFALNVAVWFRRG